MSYDVPFGGRMAGQSRPLIPSGEHHGGKGTEEKGDIQGRGEFLMCMGAVCYPFWLRRARSSSSWAVRMSI